ncbi:MAG: TraR/DksA C4-type zinc finger protein [Pseudomonadota bacterium]
MKPEDQAQEIELAEWQANQEKGRLPAPVKESAKWCIEPGCGQRIPDERREAVPGVQYCTECQEWREYMEGRHASSN